MMRIFFVILLSAPSAVTADGYIRPIPQPQSATAEFWFLAASLALIGALWGVHRLVSRR
ncbi:hypothetical protein ACOTTU_17980 [Roseobacter sp. EG26]|uniref:hypothetical protein n=1 Tax=Roseobacter sp. EG26 TaxID=3412477 RepID=UPI002625BF15|nr:hypothetical protein [uncultured Roseobacter sp.]